MKLLSKSICIWRNERWSWDPHSRLPGNTLLGLWVVPPASALPRQVLRWIGKLFSGSGPFMGERNDRNGERDRGGMGGGDAKRLGIVPNFTLIYIPPFITEQISREGGGRWPLGRKKEGEERKKITWDQILLRPLELASSIILMMLAAGKWKVY